MAMAAYIARTFAMDPVEALRGPPEHVALRLAAADVLPETARLTFARGDDAAGIPPGEE